MKKSAFYTNKSEKITKNFLKHSFSALGTHESDSMRKTAV
jgi:hypothetical protein